MTRQAVGMCPLCGTDYARPKYASLRRDAGQATKAALAEALAVRAERDAPAAKVEATPKTPLPALGDTSGTPSMISGRVRRILGDRPAPMPPIERVGWYRELARMLSVAADKWERYLAEEAARADQ